VPDMKPWEAPVLPQKGWKKAARKHRPESTVRQIVKTNTVEKWMAQGRTPKNKLIVQD
jgi:hypothetical protein